MIQLSQDRLVFSFPEVHPKARLTIDVQRTLRIPDDGSAYPLPPGLGCFSLRDVDDYAAGVPARWREQGGVMLPMYQSEAMWLNFDSEEVPTRGTSYPFAIKVATGKIDAITGAAWSRTLHRRPQDYLVAPEQPWLDGYCVEKGFIRQFVAMPLGSGYSVEEQLTGSGEHGGLQIAVYPMKREVFERRFPRIRSRGGRDLMALGGLECCSSDMGLAPGGRMRQEIYEDPFALRDWDRRSTSRCFIHIANSLVWRAITAESLPSPPPTANQYSEAGLPWFDYYAENAKPVDGSTRLAGLKTVATLAKEKGEQALPENESATIRNLIALRAGLKRGQVREGNF